VLVPLVLLKTAAFALEMRWAGLPRVPEPTRAVRFLRLVLKMAVVAGITVCSVTYVFFTWMSIDDYVKNHKELLGLLTNLLVSFFMLVVLAIIHLDWFRRLSLPDRSAFATVPALVQHLLPTQLEAADLKARIQRGANQRIVSVWVLRLAVVFIGVTLTQGFLSGTLTASPSAVLAATTTPAAAAPYGITTSLIIQLVVGMVFWLAISVSFTFFFLSARRRELGIIDGTYTESGRSRPRAIFFSLVMLAALLLSLACLAANMFRVVSETLAAGLGSSTFGFLLLSWGPIVFYVGIILDVMLIHVRNTDQDQSVCARVPIPLTMGMEYMMVADTSLAYDADF